MGVGLGEGTGANTRPMHSQAYFLELNPPQPVELLTPTESPQLGKDHCQLAMLARAPNPAGHMSEQGRLAHGRARRMVLGRMAWWLACSAVGT